MRAFKLTLFIVLAPIYLLGYVIMYTGHDWWMSLLDD